MPCERKPMRYGHSEGHTEVCFDDHGRFIVTCGNDGDVRIWESLEDDDPKFITVGEKAYSLALKNGKLVTASSNNTVQIHTFPDGEPDGILTRFTTNATHVTFNSSGSRVAAGSSDFMVKVVEVSDSSQQKTLRGHEAPVLSVTFDPKDDFLASSSCDGSVVVWNIEEQTQVISWPLLQKTNDVSNAKSLCRLAWQPRAAKFLAVPVDTKVHLYERGSWDHVSTLSDDLLTQPINVVAWSPCGQFLAAGSVGGSLTLWDVNSKLCVERQKHEKGFTVCGLAWHPSGSQIAYTDTEGCLGLLDGLGVSTADTNAPKQAPVKKPAKDYDALFDDDDDDRVLDEGLSDTNSPVKKRVAVDGDEDDDDFLIPSTGRVRNRGAILDDENSLDTGSLKLGPDTFRDDDDDTGSAVVPPSVPLVALRPVYEGPMPTPPQKAFQSGSTPAHLTHRFMMWNSVGIVRGYNDEQDNAIDVEFHDTAVHHAMHLTNSLGHTMADISQEAVLLACSSTDELASKLQCLHFSSWDTNKEWMVDLPNGEDARALCLGQGWAAVATSTLTLRLFSIGGVQREIFSLPGPVVCMVAHGEQLLIVYHRATGFDGEQALGVQLLQFGRRKRQIVNGEPLPLSLRSHLTWLGFTAEGTPCYVDSDGVVRLLNRSLGNTWTPVCHTRETCKSRSDHYWVVGAHENPQQLRCIPCKGSRYPPTLPRPAVAILPFKLPLCQTATEKGQMEEQFLRSVLFHNHYSFLSSSGYEIDEDGQSRSQKEQQELLMKMFALSCKLEREFRSVELAELMTHNVVTLAIRYASRSRRMALAQRLSDMALERANQILEEEPEEQDEEPEHKSIRRNSGYDQSEVTGGRQSNRHNREEEEEQGQELGEEEDGQEMETEETTESRKRVNPFAKEAGSPVKPSLTPIGKVGRANPFKVFGSGKPSASSGQNRVTNILDNMTSSRRSAPPGGSAGKPGKGPVLKPLAPRPKSKTQSTLLQMTGTKTANKKTPGNTEPAADQRKEAEVPAPASPADNSDKRPKTGFQLWLEENRKSIVFDHPDMEETDVIKEAMGRFRTMSAEDRLTWTERAKGQTGDAFDLKKRKRDGGEDVGSENGREEADENDAKKKKPLDSASKLSAFAFNKN
ncbi:WD repeat and HMG-box DNA-binding protein 1 isoform X1 [Hippoglossus hippoglossus]|uniref:WD repeat and HMG-box DNA-binding protein 1 isoform X1 n=1 Tax=Hippoglossus hippoglossus TaxID=8267 RepID=UPI00148CB88B|nr:WD repeat and HMG-box DNA-binding protein 1 isoform X1 [Hippoglossus hippoglossus]XP_034471223.1 WD repeat and HMG-box DNA-binding protein 1 isoform X1 [Hippoglossus hippoglossus]XP_034471232.1 WD repeat and HMG-box DNA-binding protein 1 isoform X1 [Hippoglossus hippoglossus]